MLNQDVPHEEYEIICINDGSTDSSSAILEDYANKNPNIRVIHQENGGVATARNTGLDAAMGEYIWFVDSDDIVLRNVLSQIKCFVHLKQCDRIVLESYVFQETLPEKDHISTLPKGGSHYDSVVWRNMFKRAFLQEHKLRFAYPEMIVAEDCMFIHDALIYQPQTCVYAEPVYCYRVRQGSAMTTNSAKFQKKKLESYVIAARVLQWHYTENLGDKRNTANLLMQFIWNALYLTITIPKADSAESFREMKHSGLFPCRRLPECDITRSYQTNRKDFLGRMFDIFYINMHRPWGFSLMWLLRRVISLKHKICKQ